jgi:subtilisin family serine protease
MARLSTVLPLVAGLVVFVFSVTPTLCIITDSRATTRQQSTSLNDGAARTYVVLVEPPKHANAHDEAAHRRWHESFLRPGGGAGGREPPTIRHSYTGVFSGFAAKLTEDELAAVSRKHGFVRAFPERRVPLMTTRTPGFLGLDAKQGVWNATNYGEGVVVGILDTGLAASHPSFGDEGMSPPPAKWKGTCQSPAKCNNKLVGLVSLMGGNDTTDNVGHGTHTASTATGHFVDGVSAFGLGSGTAAGTAPGAHLAMYKVCDGEGCFESDILAGMDAAVKDGVDVLSLSLGGPSLPLDKDLIAIGAFGMMSKGILVVCAGGNSGPTPSTLSNEAPWILTVAAGSVDRSYRATVRLGDGEAFDGESLTQDKRFSAKEYPLYYPQGNNYCDAFDVNITGKVVVCDTETPLPPLSSIEAVQAAGGAGVVFVNEADFGYTIVVEKYYSLPMSQVTATDGAKIMGYAREGPPSAAAPLNATILFNSTMVHVKPAPIVAAFSSRGPNLASPGVLKPDIMAPGLNILAAWPTMVPVDGTESYNYNVASGTSMATPHVTGIVALVKKAHPDWSPSAVKSAIMTTASAVDNAGDPIMDEEHRRASSYSIGAGHVDAAKAVDPGLVYDLGAEEYSAYICALLGEGSMKTITGNSNLTCAAVGSIPEAQLNYPAIVVPLSENKFKVKRTATNVGPARSRYTAHVHAPKWLKVSVEPEELEFKEAMEKKTFTVTVSREGDGGELAEGSLHWKSEDHLVRSPIIADARVVVQR